MATNLYVSTTGSDANSGSQSSPFATIAAASKAAQPGATIHVAPGNYTGGFETKASGTASAPITYVSDTPGGAIIVGGNATNPNQAGWENEGNYVNIQGFQVDGSQSTSWAFGFYNGASHVTFQKNIVHDIMTNPSAYANLTANGNGGAGIMMDSYYGGSDGNVIGNIVYNVGPAGTTSTLVHGIYQTESGKVESNLVHNVVGDGLTSWHNAQNISFINNTVDHVGGSGVLVGSSGSGTGGGFVVENNIVSNAAYGLYEEGTTGTNNVYTDNLLYNISGTQVHLQNGLKASGTVTGNPDYVNATGGNYQLQAGSPAINAGTANQAPSVDLAGTPLPQGGSYDIGAYEYVSSSPTPPAPPPPTTPSTTKPLVGAYTYIPDAWNTANNTQFQTTYNQFTSVMGAKPQTTTVGIDYSQPVSGWVGSASEEAQSYAKSGDTYQVMTVGMPMYSNAAGAGTPDQQFKTFASGANDATIKSIVDAWASQGFGKGGNTLDFRLGWEMDLVGTPTYAGGAANDADWLAAYKHMYTVLHQEAATDGINLRVVWNPGMQNNNTLADITPLYPGSSYVDVIGADVYAGGQTNNLPQFLTWAEQQGKPFAVEETGAGDAANPGDTTDNATFPGWVAGQLSTAESAGLNVQYVTIWDGQADEFSNGTKPNEAAAWKQNFGAGTPATPPPPSTSPGYITLRVSEDAYLGDAQFVVRVDGVQVGNTMTASVLHASGDGNVFTLAGNWGASAHDVQIQFLNDAYGGTAATDRNLYVNSIAYDGTTYAGTTLAMYSAGTHDFTVGGSTATAAAPADTLTVHLAEDAYQGNADFTVAVDGKQISTPQAVLATHASGTWEDHSFAGNFGAGTHTVTVTFTNDAYGGTAATDRNLYVNGIDLNGTHYGTGVSALLSTGSTASFVVTTVR